MGMEVEGVLLKPVGFDRSASGTRCWSSRTAGRPARSSTTTVSAASRAASCGPGQGWAVFYPNPRGSTNYGEKFLQANINDWGGGDYRDIMTGVDAMIARGIADPERLAHIGWSYGGYMTAWVITQTNRFKAAMVGRGPDEHGEHVRHQRHSQRARHLLRRHSAARRRCRSTPPIGDDVHRQRDDADADSARRQRRARADRPGVRAVPRPQGSRQDHGARVLSARGPRHRASITIRRIG